MLPAVLSAVAAVSLIVHGARAGTAGREIRLMRDGGVYHVSVTLDGWLARSFIVDTGSAEVQLSTEVLHALFPRGSVPPMDLPGRRYRLGDGRDVRDRRILIPILRVGDREFHQVAASIGGPGAPLLLGQNVLEQLGVWSIDSRRSVLVLGGLPVVAASRPVAASRDECANWRTASRDCEVAVVREFLRDVRPAHEITNLRLLRSDGSYASVLVDVVRQRRGRTARLCGPMDLHRTESGWRVVGASGLRDVGSVTRCPPILG